MSDLFSDPAPLPDDGRPMGYGPGGTYKPVTVDDLALYFQRQAASLRDPDNPRTQWVQDDAVALAARVLGNLANRGEIPGGDSPSHEHDWRDMAAHQACVGCSAMRPAHGPLPYECSCGPLGADPNCPLVDDAASYLACGCAEAVTGARDAMKVLSRDDARYEFLADTTSDYEPTPEEQVWVRKWVAEARRVGLPSGDGRLRDALRAIEHESSLWADDSHVQPGLMLAAGVIDVMLDQSTGDPTPPKRVLMTQPHDGHGKDETCPGCGNRYDGDNFCMPSACEREE